jgi:hypothetical protein
LDLTILVKLRIDMYPHFPKALSLYPRSPELLDFFPNTVSVAHLLLDSKNRVGRHISIGDLHQASEPRDDVEVGKGLEEFGCQ